MARRLVKYILENTNDEQELKLQTLPLFLRPSASGSIEIYAFRCESVDDPDGDSETFPEVTYYIRVYDTGEIVEGSYLGSVEVNGTVKHVFGNG